MNELSSSQFTHRPNPRITDVNMMLQKFGTITIVWFKEKTRKFDRCLEKGRKNDKKDYYSLNFCKKSSGTDSAELVVFIVSVSQKKKSTEQREPNP